MKELKGTKVSVEEVLADQSDAKGHSHTLLQAMLAEQPTICTSRVCKNKELEVLLRLYDAAFNASSDKEKLSERLMKCIREEPGFLVSSNRQQGTVSVEIDNFIYPSLFCFQSHSQYIKLDQAPYVNKQIHSSLDVNVHCKLL